MLDIIPPLSILTIHRKEGWRHFDEWKMRRNLVLRAALTVRPSLVLECFCRGVVIGHPLLLALHNHGATTDVVLMLDKRHWCHFEDLA